MNKLEEQALEAVGSALDGRTGTIEAAHLLWPILAMNNELAAEDDLNLIRAVVSETDDLPIGRVREQWHPESLREKDREIARCEELWHEEMISTCQRIRRTLLLRKLIVDGHLNVAERQLVIPVQRCEVATILRSILRADSVFPAKGREGFAYEGAIIGLVSLGAEITLSRTHPAHPQLVAERRVERYEKLDAAIEAFIDCEWRNGIDGIQIEPGTECAKS